MKRTFQIFGRNQLKYLEEINSNRLYRSNFQIYDNTPRLKILKTLASLSRLRHVQFV